MTDATPQSTFRGLPLTPEQDAEVRHYIKKKEQHGAPWDTPELEAMLRDMLQPPSDDDGGLGSTVDETKAASGPASTAVQAGVPGAWTGAVTQLFALLLARFATCVPL